MARRKTNTFKPNIKGIGELLKSIPVATEMIRRAEKGRAYAERIAPRSTGQFAESFYVRATREGGRKQDRAVAYLGNDDPAAVPIEFGTKDTTAHRTLRRAAAEAMGD